MNTVKIYTPFDCLVVGKNSSEFLSQNENIVVDENEKLFVYPIGKPQNFSFVLTPSSPSPFYRSITSNGERLIFLLGGETEGVLLNSYSLFSLSFMGKTCHVKVGKDRVVFSYDNIEKEVFLPFEIQNFKHQKEEHIVYVLLNGTFDCLVAFNLKTKDVKSFCGEKITLSANKFTLENGNQTSEYLFDSDGLSILSTKLNPLSNFLAPNFFAHLKQHDFPSAYSLLSKPLQETLSLADFKRFFGSISYFFPISPTKVFAISNNIPKLYTLTIHDNLLADIDDEQP